MSKAPKSVIAGAILFGLVFVITGLGMLDLSQSKMPYEFVKEFDQPVVALHVICWMWLGIFANYFWDLYRAQGSMHRPNYSALIAPLLVSPMVLFTFYSMIDPTKITFAINLIAFQNGFFWQTIFAKVGSTMETHPSELLSTNKPPPQPAPQGVA